MRPTNSKQGVTSRSLGARVATFQSSVLVCAVALWMGVVAGVQAASVVTGTGRHGIAATIHPLATDAAMAALSNGGNAVDAAVAAGLTLGVVDGQNSGIGGGCFILLRLADGQVLPIDGREQAPAGASRDMFLREGKADSQRSQTGALAVAVPGALAAYAHAATNYGRIPWATHLSTAAQLAEQGFNPNRDYAQRLASTADELRRFPAAREIFLDADGRPWQVGDLVRQPDLAATYRAVVEHGVEWFYGGPFAKKTEDWMQANGGLMRLSDFKDYRLKMREPLRTTYRGYEIVGFPPPSSGGVHVAQLLNILENFELKKMGAGSAAFIHVVAEAMKLAFADRAYWLGDPDFASVPRGLVTKEYAAALARQIERKHVTPVSGAGMPEGATTDLFKHTTHFSMADAEGNWVACTATINTSFGSKVVVPGTGVLLNNEMDDFSSQPGVPNAFGLVGAEANAVAPGKRPLSSMSPTLVLKNGQPILSLGAAGGPTIISQTLLTLLYCLDFGMPVERALEQVRFHHQWRPDELRIERKAGESVLKDLRKRGHVIREVDRFGATQAIAWDPDKERFLGSADPRSEGSTKGN